MGPRRHPTTPTTDEFGGDAGGLQGGSKVESRGEEQGKGVGGRRQGQGERLYAGFVDLQVNGYLGTSFSSMELTYESCVQACVAILERGGCCAIVPTVITAPPAVYEHVLPILAEAIENEPRLRGRILGLHLEGPFISGLKGAVGTHPASCVLPPASADGIALLERWQRLARGHIKLLTIAAEADGAAAFCAHATSKMGMRVSLGHMLAAGPEISALAAAGATLLTHLGNGCPNEIHRHKNHLWPTLSDDRLSAMLITDGQHLPPDAIACFMRCKGIARTIITSDVAPVAGLPDGEYACFGGHVYVEGKYVRNADRTCLAGSGALMLDCMNHLASLSLKPLPGETAPLSVEQLMDMGFANPLRAVGLDPDAVAKERLACDGAKVAFEGGQFRLV